MSTDDSHRASQAVLRSGVDEVQCLLVVRIVVDEGGDDGAEDLLNHGDALRVLGEDDCRLDEVALRVVPRAADEDLAASILRLLDVAGDFVERSFATVRDELGSNHVLYIGDAHDRTNKVREVRRRADLEFRDLVQKLQRSSSDSGPMTSTHVHR